MTPEFLAEFPELRADIRCTEEIEGWKGGGDEDRQAFENIGEGFGLGSLEELELLSGGFLGGEGGF
jgi:hypothetical protein